MYDGDSCHDVGPNRAGVPGMPARPGRRRTGGDAPRPGFHLCRTSRFLPGLLPPCPFVVTNPSGPPAMRPIPRSRSRAGAAAVEFAVILPLLMLLLLGTWEVARLVQVHAILSNAAREGARVAAQGQIINLTGGYTQIVVSDTNPNNP